VLLVRPMKLVNAGATAAAKRHRALGCVTAAVAAMLREFDCAVLTPAAAACSVALQM
jgi:hypothetical protein